MAKLSKAEVDRRLRDKVFTYIFDLKLENSDDLIERFAVNDGSLYCKINDRQWGALVTDANGEQRYVRIGAIVAEQREDMTAKELMEAEIEEYRMKQKAKEEKAKAKEAKIAKDKARREKEKEEKANEN